MRLILFPTIFLWCFCFQILWRSPIACKHDHSLAQFSTWRFKVISYERLVRCIWEECFAQQVHVKVYEGIHINILQTHNVQIYVFFRKFCTHSSTKRVFGSLESLINIISIYISAFYTQLSSLWTERTTKPLSLFRKITNNTNKTPPVPTVIVWFFMWLFYTLSWICSSPAFLCNSIW